MSKGVLATIFYLFFLDIMKYFILTFFLIISPSFIKSELYGSYICRLSRHALWAVCVSAYGGYKIINGGSEENEDIVDTCNKFKLKYSPRCETFDFTF